VPYDPQPADGAIDVGDDFTLRWQCDNPDSDIVFYMTCIGFDSLNHIIGYDTTKCVIVPWGKQSRARGILIQIHQMQMAYHNQYQSYCLNGGYANRTDAAGFSRIGVIIDSTDCYRYGMTAENNSFTCVASANLDNDATIDTWKIDQTGVLDHIISDFTDFTPIDFQPATTYSWQVLVIDDHYDTTSSPIWHFTTTSSIIPPGYEVGLPRFPMPEDYSVGVTGSTILYWFCMPPEDDSLTYDLYLGLGDEEPQPAIQNLTTSQTFLEWGKQWKVQQVLGQIYRGEQFFKENGYDSCYVLNGISARYGYNYFHMLGVDMESIDSYNYTISASCDTFVCIAAANIDADPDIDNWTIDQNGVIRHVFNDSDMPFSPGQSYTWKIVAHDTRGNSYEGPIWHFTTSE
jgi:hypothetical protein